MQFVNLYQTQFKPKKVIFPAKQIGLLLLLSIVVFAVISLYASKKNSLQQQVLVEQQQRYNKSQQQLTVMQQQVAAHAGHPLLKAELADIQRQVKENQTLLNYLTLHSFGNQNGFSATLTGLSQQRIDNVWLTEFSLMNGGQFISLQGNALQSDLIPEYIDNLAKSERFQGKQFSVFQLLQPSDGRDFYSFHLQTPNTVEGP